MIAFEIFGRPVYRYGIFYGITFIFGYWFFWRVAKQEWITYYPQVKNVLLHKKDDLFIACILGVVLWWRLGHCIFYEWSYYSQHLLEIFLINQWGMSFIWWLVGVVFALWILIRIRKLSFESMKLIGDVIVCIVPIGVFLWRIGNWLNQELRWKPLDNLSSGLAQFLETLNLTRVYSTVDELVRVDTNTIQAATEWLCIWLVVRTIVLTLYPKKPLPWLISSMFLILYGLIRYWVEPLKDLPVNEMVWPLSISQRIMILFVVFGGILLIHVYQKNTNYTVSN